MGAQGPGHRILKIQRQLAQGFLSPGWGEGFKRRCTSSELTWSLTVKRTQYVHRTEGEWRTIPKRGYFLKQESANSVILGFVGFMATSPSI